MGTTGTLRPILLRIHVFRSIRNGFRIVYTSPERPGTESVILIDVPVVGDRSLRGYSFPTGTLIPSMATQAQPSGSRTSVDRPDTPYSIVGGLYGAALLVPAVVLVLARVVTDAAVLYVCSLVVVACLTVSVGWSVSRIRGLAVEFGRRDAAWLLGVLPFGWASGLFGATSLGFSLPAIAVPPAILGTGGGALFGIVLVSTSRTRHVGATLEETTQSAEWEARYPRRWRQLALVVVLGLLVVGVVQFAARSLLGLDTGWGFYYLLYFWVPLVVPANPRTFRVTTAGLVVERPLHRQFRPWSAFTRYERTDDALVIRSAAWWRPAHRCDIADIDHIDSVVAALDECLPRK
jgi:hypothetical protein